MRVRCVFFDYGGTLDGEASHWLDRFVSLHRAEGVAAPFEEIEKAFYRADEACYARSDLAGRSLRDLMDFHVGVQLAALGIPDERLHRRLLDAFVGGSEEALARSRTVLARLSGRFRLGVISNFYGNLARVLADAGLAPHLSAIVDSSAVGLWKPDARIFAHALAEIGAHPSEALHAGDSYERDIEGAHRAGLHTAWLTGDSDREIPGDRTAVDLRIRSLDELVNVLDYD
jgi:HAD superfamily hydrolase (TIGR01549 family)